MAPFRPTLRLLTKQPSVPLFSTPSLLLRPLQIYRSPSTNPYLNLAIEHFLLRRTPPHSAVLFLYINRPSVIIGRNQNPWLEVNLSRLRRGLSPSPAASSPIDLVRRRSGGGTVFHDHGNVNWSVICPSASFDFDRNTHAEMVARALRRLGVEEARVNERHDLVVGPNDEETYKISGSAYKLITGRALHHGTCLLSSPNLGEVGALLRSPAEGYIYSKGVRSVRSPIRNVGVGNEEFVEEVVSEFGKMYEGGEGVVVVNEEEAGQAEWVREEMKTIMSDEWRFGQTPQFTFSTSPTEEDPRERELPAGLPSDLHIHLDVRKGIIDPATASISGLQGDKQQLPLSEHNEILDQTGKPQLYKISDWGAYLGQEPPSTSTSSSETQQVGAWLNELFGTGPSI